MIPQFSHKLHLHPGQMEVFRSPHRFKVVVAGRRWGKSVLSRTEMIRRAKQGKQKIWYIAPTYRMAKQIMWDELVTSIPAHWIRKKNETSMSIYLVNGSVIECKGADKPDTLRGVGLNFVVMDEFQDMKWETWEMVLRPTLSSTLGSALFIGTPKSYNHLYGVYSLGQREDYQKAGVWMSWQFSTIESPFIMKSEIEAARRDMDLKSFRQEYEASFETMSSRVYYPFDRKVHVGTFPFNPSLPIWVGQDFNIDPMSSAIIQPQKDGKLWIVDEIVLKASNTEEVVTELERRYWRNMDQVTIFPDPAGSYRQHARGETDLDIFRERGFKRISYRKKHPPVADRVNSVNRMLMTADGQVHMHIDARCKEVIRSLELTSYLEGGRDIDKSGGMEHMTDALGYPIERMYPVRRFEPMGWSY